MNKAELPRDLEFDQLIRDTWMWVDDHTIRIAIGAAIGVAIIVLLYGLKIVGKKLATNTDNHWRCVIGRALKSMRLWFIVPAAIQIVSNYAHAPEDVALTVRFVFTIVFALQAALFARELILGTVEIRAQQADPGGSLGNAVGLIRLLTSVALFVVAIILILSNLGVNVTGLVAGLGVGGIAIGLAAKDVFSDLFAALSILFDKPFRRGDFIRWESGSGTVEAIGLKSTRLRATSGEEVIVSNTNLLSKELLNVTMSQRRRITQPLGLVYQTTPAQCERLPEMLRETVDAIDDCHYLRCVFDSFGASSLDFILTYDIGSHEIDVISDRKHAVNVAILKRFEAERLSFAYPTSVSYSAAPDGRLVMPWADPA